MKRLILPLVAFVLTRAAIFLWADGARSDVSVYFRAATLWRAGSSPYDEPLFRYPPLALFYSYLPFLVSGNDAHRYDLALRLQSYLIDVGVFILLVSARVPGGALWCYLASSTLLGQLLYSRLDIGLAFLVILSAVLYRKGTRMGAYLVLGLATAFKVIPVVVLPSLLVFEWRERAKMPLLAAFSFATGILIPTLLGLHLIGLDSLSFFLGHAQRGVQIESLWGSIQAALAILGIEGKVYFEYGSFNFHTCLEPALSLVSSILVLILIILSVPLAHSRITRGRDPWVGGTATLIGCLCLSKVLSPQFLIFLLPLMALVEPTAWTRPYSRLLLIAACLLTTWIFPYNYFRLTDCRVDAILILLMRNGILVVLAILVYLKWIGSGGAERSQVPPGSDIGILSPSPVCAPEPLTCEPPDGYDQSK